MNRLGIFARHWTPGQAKTRLAARCGNEGAARLQLAFLTCLVGRLAKVTQSQTLAITPEESRDEFVALAGPEWDVVAQGAGNLGQRMERFFRWSARQGGEKTVLIGSDLPTLAACEIAPVWAALDRYPVALGPAADGGYYLIGLRGDVMPPLFQEIEWGTNRVWPETIARLNRAGIPYFALPERYDIDEWPDLIRLEAELASLPLPDIHLATLHEVVSRELSAAAL